jgi:hypothetical protein
MNNEASTAMSYQGMVVVVPTRNRAQLAINAVRSVLEQTVENVEVLVSDNSTLEPERDELAAFCAGLSNSRVRYVRPPVPLAMPAHWDWAIEQALAAYSANHFIYLTDRMMVRNNALKEMVDLAALYPLQVISYNLDRICDDAMPIRIEQYPATEKLLEVETLRLSRLFAQGVFHPGLPRMLNCIVPRVVFDRMRQRFGNVFSSIAPDFNFCVRCLDIEDSILFFDKSPLFHYALNRSTGASATRGEMTPDNADFTANLPVDNSIRNYATPIPSLITAVNAAFNEYLIHKQQTNSPRFFDVDLQQYLSANAIEINEVRDPKLRTEMMALLAKHGYRETANSSATSSAPEFMARLKRVPKKLTSGARTKPAWLFLARRLGIKPPGEVEFEFWELAEAIDYARNISRGNHKPWSIQVELLQGRERLRGGSRA